MKKTTNGMNYRVTCNTETNTAVIKVDGYEGITTMSLDNFFNIWMQELTRLALEEEKTVNWFITKKN